KDKLYSKYKEYFERDGIVKQRVMGKWICIISDPVMLKDILLNPDVYPKMSIEKKYPNTPLAEYLGTNVAFSTGDVWKRHRRVCNSAFKSLPLHLFAEAALKMINILETIDNKPIEITSMMQRFTLDLLGKVVFGFDFNCLENPNNVYVKAYHEVQNSALHPLSFIFPIDRIPIIKQQRLKKVAKINDLFNNLIKEKHKDLAAGKSYGDLLEHMLIANENSDNQMLSDNELRYNIAIFMLAGHETTAIALSTVLYLLSTHKNVQEKAREEVLRILGDNLIPSTEEQKSLKYLNMVIYENLRLYPPASINLFFIAPTLVHRELIEDLKFKNFVIPAGTLISPFLYGMHHSPKIWDNPEEFLPERFENKYENSENSFWVPFGGGAR
ncbi:5660_t:CDS:10, partial [Dentiscutata erythropus]